MKEVYSMGEDGFWRKVVEFPSYGRVTIIRDKQWRVVSKSFVATAAQTDKEPAAFVPPAKSSGTQASAPG